MKKNIVILFILSFISLNFFSFEHFKTSIKVESGVLNGTVNEYVFLDECKNTDNMLSMLVWDLIDIPYKEITIELDIFNKFNLSFTGKFTDSYRSGCMQDYDWRNSDPQSPSSWHNEDPTELTDYSIHKNKLNDFYSFRIAAGYNFNPHTSLKITPFAAWDYDYIYFTAYDGYGIYKSMNFNQINYNGKQISYTNEFNSIMLGLKVAVYPIDKLSFSFIVMHNFGFGFNTAIDYHLGRQTVFWDDINFTGIVKVKSSVYFRVTKNIDLGLSYNIHVTPLKTGNNYQNELDSDGNIISKLFRPTSSLGGNSNNIWCGGISCSIKF